MGFVLRVQMSACMCVRARMHAGCVRMCACMWLCVHMCRVGVHVWVWRGVPACICAGLCVHKPECVFGLSSWSSKWPHRPGGQTPSEQKLLDASHAGLLSRVAEGDWRTRALAAPTPASPLPPVGAPGPRPCKDMVLVSSCRE